MKKLLLSSFCLAASVLANAQTPNLKWAKSMGGTLADGGYAIAIDASGNVYTTGPFYGTVDFDPGAGTFNLISAGQNDIFISKLDASGNFVWAKGMGGNTYDAGRSIAVDASGNVYTAGQFGETVDFDPGAGTFNLTSAGVNDIFVLKLDASGNFAWAKQFGGTLQEIPWSLTLDVSGNIYTTGSFEGTADFDPGAGINNLTSVGKYDIFISKLNSSGNFVWVKGIGGTEIDQGYSIKTDASANVYSIGNFKGFTDFDPGSGSFNLTASRDDTYILKLDATGNFVWAKQMRASYSITGFSLALDASANVYTTGQFQDTVDFDPGTGKVNLISAGSNDIFISKLDASGNFKWAKQIGGKDIDAGYSITLDALGNIFSTGSFQGTVDFDPNVSVLNLITNAGSLEMYILKLDASGNMVWAKSMGFSGAKCSIVPDASGNFYTTGSFTGTVDCDLTAGVSSITSAGGTDVFVIKMNQTTGGIMGNAKANNLSIYPNPNTGAFVIQAKTNGFYTLVNQLGQTIQSFETNAADNYTVNFSQLSPGIYYVIGKNDNALIRQKIIITK